MQQILTIDVKLPIHSYNLPLDSSISRQSWYKNGYHHRKLWRQNTHMNDQVAAYRFNSLSFKTKLIKQILVAQNTKSIQYYNYFPQPILIQNYIWLTTMTTGTKALCVHFQKERLRLRERERESVCVCVCVCVRARERETE